ncbi:MAG: hypothetical protein U0R80_13065 [Nocardioidaceae bacterium]
MPSSPIRFVFAFDASHRWSALAFGVTPATTWAELDDLHLRVRFGWWRLTTPRANIVGAEVTSGYSWWRTAGPPRLSLADRGITLATNSERGVCLRFAEPVKVVDPTGTLRHPGATLTLADPETFLAVLAET